MSIFKGLKPYRLGLILVFILTFANAIGELLLPYLLSQIVDRGVVAGSMDIVFDVGFWMVIVTLITVLVRGSASFVSARVAMGYSRDLRQRIFEKVNKLTFDETEEFGISSLITRSTNDISQIEQMMLMSMRPLLRAPLQFVGGLIMALLAHVQLTLIVLLSIPFTLVVILFIVKRVMPAYPQVQRALDSINRSMRQRLTGLKVTRAFNRDEAEQDSFEEANREHYDKALEVNYNLSIAHPFLVTIVGLTQAVAVLFGARFITEGTLEVGTLMAFIQYTTQMLTGVAMFARVFMIFPRSMASIRRVSEVVDYPTRQVGGRESLSSDIETIEARDLSFTYPGSNAPALENLNFKLEKGQVVGIIGGTGSGKSTLLKLFLQFYDPTSGELLVNGKDITTLDQKEVRQELSYVPQQNFFFTNTVRGNMQYSSPNVEDARLIENLETAEALHFLDSDSPLDQKMIRGGTNFSGGQRQRLAISRALARDASVYIFDDSFSALDYLTDYEIRKNLSHLSESAMTVIVAQRVATIRHADQILVLDEGQLVASGNHQELMKESKIYQEIAHSQAEEGEGLDVEVSY